MFEKFKDKAKRVLAGVLALTMMIPGYVPSLAATDTLEEPANPSLPSISVEWGAGEFISEDGSSTDIVEYDDTTNNVKLKVSYYQKEVVETGYAAGDLVITVKGIGALNRPGTMEALVGADKYGTEIKTRDWTYTWNKATDTYTFVNNEAIEPGSVFSGYFELIWSFKSRDDITDYAQQDVQAVMYMPTGEYVESNILTFSNETFCDKFENDINSSGTYLINRGLDDLVDKDPNDYVWVCYNLSRDITLWRSRGLAKGPYDYFNPDSTGVGSGAIVIKSLSGVSVGDMGDGSYLVPLGSEKHVDGYVWVAYPRDEYEGKTVTATLNTYGTFHEYDDNKVVGNVLLASDACDVLIEGYLSEPSPQGDYTLKKSPWYSYAMNKSNGVPFSISHTIYGHVSYDYDGLVDMEISDDALYVRQSDGTYRKLCVGEYWMNYITVPAASSLTDAYGDAVENPDDYTYAFDVYAVQNGETLVLSEENLVSSGELLTNSTQDVALPEGTTSVSVVYRDIDSMVYDNRFTVNTTIQLDDSNNTDGAPIDYATSNVVNTAYVRIYDKDGNWLNYGPETYSLYFESSHASEATAAVLENDIATYGNTLHRQSAIVYLRKTTNYNRVYSTTHLSDVVLSNNKYTTEFRMGASFSTYDECYPSKFSIYTVLPDYVSIYKCENAEDLFNTMELSGFGFTSDYLKEHCTVELIEDYKESGGTYVALHFDFSNAEVPHSSDIEAIFTLKIDNVYYEGSDSVILVKSAVDAESISDDNTYYSLKTTDDGEWYTDYPTSDINNDGSTTDILAYSVANIEWLYAASSQWQQVKKVETSRTDGDYVITSEEDTREDYPEAEYGSVYSYMLSVTTGNSLLKDAVIYDYLEQGEQAEWQGTFKSVDLSYVKKLDIEPVVYYSTNPAASQDLASGDWTTEVTDASAVKAIAIDLRAYEIPEKTSVHVVINMIAPTDATLKNKITENEYFSVGTMVDLTTGIETVIGDDLPSNLIQVRLVPPYRRLTITKTDAVDGAKLSGAVFELYVKNEDGSQGSLIASGTTNSKGVLTFKDLPEDQEYLLVETSAPQGYVATENNDIVFSGSNIGLTIKNDRKTGSVKLVKSSNMLSSIKVEGAEYTIYDADGNVIATAITDANGELTFADLGWGEYIVKETKSPDGYQLNDTEYVVSIERENVDIVQTINTVDDQNPVSVHLEKYAADAQGNPLETPLSGAVFELLRKVSDDNYKSVGTYVTDKNGHIDISELVYGDYIIRETRAPQGYNLCEDIEFTLSPEMTDVSLTAYDTRKTGAIIITKNDDMGSFVEGAEFTLYAEDKTTVLATVLTDDGGMAAFSGLEWGTYYVKETKAPQGYVLDETFHYVNISASKLTVNLNVTNETMKGDVLLTKTDEAGVYKLEGAEFSLYTNLGSLVAEGLVTDENGQILVEDLPWGSYYFEETKAPVGYGLNTEKIRFSVNYKNCEITQELEVTDPQENRVITLTKRIKADEVNFDNGNPSFTLKLEGTDVNGNFHTYYRVVTFTEDYVEANTDEDGYVSIHVTISGFLAGEYVASEEESARYYLESISEYDGTKVGNTIVFDMVNNDYGKATFTNKRYEGQNFSDTGTVTNVLNEKAKLTGITANWTADTLVEANTAIDRNNLVVTAYYDDGTFEVLENDAYELSENTFPNRNGAYTIKVSYTYNDVTKSDSFDVELFGMKLSIVAITAEPAVDYVMAGQKITPDMIKVTAHFSDGTTTEILDYGFQYADPVVLHTNDASQYGGNERTLSFDNASSLTVDITSTAYTDRYNKFGYNAVDADGTDVSQTYDKSSSGTTISNEVATNSVTVFTSSSSTNNNLVDITFTITPNYDIAEVPADYILDVATAPTTGGVVDINVRLNPDVYDAESELALTTTVALNVNVGEANLIGGSAFKTILSNNFSAATSVVFTDEEIPTDATVYDVSANFEESVFAWIDSNNTVHVSSGVTGKHIIAPDSTGSMFYGRSKLTGIDFSNFYITDKTTAMNSMFYGCTKLANITGMSHVDASNISSMAYMFQNCSALTNVSGLSGWKTSSLTDMTYMFTNCSSLTNVDGLADWDVSHVTKANSLFSGCSKLENVNGLANWKFTNLKDMNSMFSGCSKLENIDGLKNWDVSGATNMTNMFKNCYAITNIDSLMKWDVEDVMNMTYMFYGCRNLLNVDGLAEWNTSGLTDVNNMFYGCTNLTNVTGMSKWDVDSVSNMNYMFYNCSNLGDISGLTNWDVSAVGTMNCMFYGCKALTNVNSLAAWTPIKATKMASMFRYCSSLTNVDGLKNWDVSSVTDMSYMFASCTSLTNVDGLAKWDISAVQYLDNMFYDCSNLSNLSGLSEWDLTSGPSVTSMFQNCTSLTNLDSLAKWQTGTITSTKSMFSGCSGLVSLTGLADWNVGIVMDMSSMFSGCSNLSNLSDLAKWNVSSVATMDSLFYGCTNLENVNGLTNWDVSSVTDMDYMFYDCDALADLGGLANWDVGSVANMGYMFYDCDALTEVSGLNDWNTDSLEFMSYMFYHCDKLSNLDGLTKWNVSSVTNMRGVFYTCESLTEVDALARWDVSNVQYLDEMFYQCFNLVSLDLWGWNVSSVTTISNMFRACNSLMTIYGQDWTAQNENVATAENVFDGCDLLTGGANTTTAHSGANCTPDGGYFSRPNTITLTVDNQCSDVVSIDVPDVVYGGFTEIALTPIDGVTLYSFEVNGVETFGSTFIVPDESGTVVISNAKYWSIDVPDTVTIEQPIYGKPGVTEIKLTAVDENQVVAFFTVNGTLVKGDSFVLPEDISNITISDVIFVEPTVIESAHNPYETYQKDVSYGVAHYEGATSLTVELTYQTPPYSSNDYIYLYDADGNIVNNKKYNSDNSSDRYSIVTDTIIVEGDYVDIRFTTRYDTSYYGFKAVVTPNYPAPPIELTIDNQASDILSVSVPDVVISGHTQVPVVPVDGYLIYSFEVNGAETTGTTFTAPENSGTVVISNPKYWTIDLPDGFTVVQPDVVEPGVTEIQLVNGDNIIHSFEVNGELVEGDSFVIPEEIGTVTISNVTQTEIVIVESDHNPYLNNQSDVVYAESTFDGATSITVELTYQTEKNKL